MSALRRLVRSGQASFSGYIQAGPRVTPHCTKLVGTVSVRLRWVAPLRGVVTTSLLVCTVPSPQRPESCAYGQACCVLRSRPDRCSTEPSTAS